MMTGMVVEPPAVGHAFLSYVHEDSAPVDALCTVLEAAGIEVWRDREQLWPGDDWKLQIRRAIQRNSLAFIACFSAQSIARTKSYQNEELTLAVEEFRLRPPGRPWLFPVRFDDVDLPDFDLGPGKTLDSLQRTDLFGEKREPELTRIAISISRVIGMPLETTAGSDDRKVPVNPHENVGKTASPSAEDRAANQPHDDNPSTAISAPQRIKQLLRDATKDIELDDLVTETADIARRECLDTVRFPSSANDMRSSVSAGRLVIERTDQYWKIVQPVAGVLAVGCAWGRDDQVSLWSRAMRTVANTTPMEGGQTTLLNLRGYPRVMALYAAGMGAVFRENYAALRAVTTDAKYREDGQAYPVIEFCNPWLPFYDAPLLAEVMARHTDGHTLSDEEIDAISRNLGGRRKTPVSDDLHTRLRETMKLVIRDDEEYDETFDKLEVLLGLIAQDVANQEKGNGRYLSGGWTGRYAWLSRSRNGTYADIYDEFRSQGSSWAPLTVFGHSTEQADKAFTELAPQVNSGRRLY
jgi:TIR domain